MSVLQELASQHPRQRPSTVMVGNRKNPPRRCKIPPSLPARRVEAPIEGVANPPTSVIAYTIPTDASRPYLEQFSAIKEPILGPSYPHSLPPKSRSRLDFLESKAAKYHLLYDLPDGIQQGPYDGVYRGRLQPDIFVLPDLRDCWDNEGCQRWPKRAAIAIKRYHVLYLREKEAPLDLNEHAHYQVAGKMFLLKVSKARDITGRRFYVDVDCDARELDALVKSLGDQEYFGPRKWEKGILAAKISLDGPESHLQYIHTVTKDFRPSHLLAEDEFDADVRYIKDEVAEPGIELGLLLSRLERVSLPDTQPYYPEPLSPQDLKTTRAVICNSKFHAFIGRAGGEEEEEEGGGGLAYKHQFTLVKVSGDVDRNGRWFYEDINADPGQLRRELSHNMKQLISYFQV